ncbi:hypothetical protein M1271_06775 [Patescibacteria group bacterium]|nr:hypothetical protein [Patescibacteria group bacterium]
MLQIESFMRPHQSVLTTVQYGLEMLGYNLDRAANEGVLTDRSPVFLHVLNDLNEAIILEMKHSQDKMPSPIEDKIAYPRILGSLQSIWERKPSIVEPGPNFEGYFYFRLGLADFTTHLKRSCPPFPHISDVSATEFAKPIRTGIAARLEKIGISAGSGKGEVLDKVMSALHDRRLADFEVLDMALGSAVVSDVQPARFMRRDDYDSVFISLPEIYAMVNPMRYAFISNWFAGSSLAGYFPKSDADYI